MRHFAWVLLLASACSSSGTPSEGSSDSGADASAIDSGGDAKSDADDGACAIPCAANCCTTGSICISDSAGNKSCAIACSHSSECASQVPDTCCASLSGGPFVGQGACLPAAGNACLCGTNTDCTSALGGPACAPQVSNDVPTGVYVCKPQDQLAWDGCYEGSLCATGYSCWEDYLGNSFCARSCNTTSTCGGAHACCSEIDAGAKCIENDLTCGGVGGCMPCGE